VIASLLLMASETVRIHRDDVRADLASNTPIKASAKPTN
jgi:hypothetical protein